MARAASSSACVLGRGALGIVALAALHDPARASIDGGDVARHVRRDGAGGGRARDHLDRAERRDNRYENESQASWSFRHVRSSLHGLPGLPKKNNLTLMDSRFPRILRASEGGRDTPLHANNCRHGFLSVMRCRRSCSPSARSFGRKPGCRVAPAVTSAGALARSGLGDFHHPAPPPSCLVPTFPRFGQ